MIEIEQMSILIVEDVKSMRNILRKMLKGLDIGNNFFMAENGVEALKIMNTTRIDLAIIDLRMPVMDGSELVEIMRSDKHFRDIPILIVSAESQTDIVLETAEIEVEGYLIKPVTPDLLDKTIRQIVEQINHPDKADLHIKKARLLEEKGNISDALKHMKAAEKRRPKASRILRNLGLLHGKNGNRDAMEKYLKKAVEANAMDAVSRYLLAEHYWKQNDLLCASEYFLEVLSMTHKYSNRAMELAELLFKKKINRLARNLFSNIISNDDKNLKLKEKIIDISIYYRDIEFARQILKQVLKTYPSNPEFNLKMGDIHEMCGEMDKALEYYLTVEKIVIGNNQVKLKIAKIFLMKKKIIQADNFLNKVLLSDPKNEEALMLRQQI